MWKDQVPLVLEGVAYGFSFDLESIAIMDGDGNIIIWHYNQNKPKEGSVDSHA